MNSLNLNPIYSAANTFLISPIASAIHFIALRQPGNLFLRYTANAVRLTYIANVIVGIVSAVFRYAKEKDAVAAAIVFAVSFIPGGGFWVADIVFDLKLPIFAF